MLQRKFNRILTAVLIAVSLATVQKAEAFILDLNLFYFSDTFKISDNQTSTRMFGDLALGLDVDKKGQWILGWNVGYVSAADQSTGSTTTYTVTEMGPKFGYFLDKERIYGIWATYNLVVNGAYSTGGGTAETWRGSSIKIELGVTPPINTEMFAGVKLIYHSETFNESLIGSTNYSQVAYTRSFIYPSLNFSMRY
jgi:hypothetical protein